MGWTEVGQYSKVVKCPLENQYFASYIAIAAIYFERICILFNLIHFLLDNVTFLGKSNTLIKMAYGSISAYTVVL